MVRALASSDVLIVGGGDLIRDDLGWRTFFFTMEKIVAAILMGKRVYLVNMGIGQLSTRYGRTLLKWTLRRCQRIIVRDARSEKVCRELGVTEQVTLAPDIVLSLPDLLGHQKVTNVASPDKNPYVLVSLRHNPGTFHSYEMSEARIRTLAQSLDGLIEQHDVDVVFLPLHVDGGHQQQVCEIENSPADQRVDNIGSAGRMNVVDDVGGIVARRAHGVAENERH